jgi:hypothetical protein
VIAAVASRHCAVVDEGLNVSPPGSTNDVSRSDAGSACSGSGISTTSSLISGTLVLLEAFARIVRNSRVPMRVRGVSAALVVVALTAVPSSEQSPRCPKYLRDRGHSTLGRPVAIVDHDRMRISLCISMNHMPLCIPEVA